MKKSGIAAALLGTMLVAGSSAVFAQVKQVYWTTSGMFGPFPITGLIPTVPKEKQRDITIPVSMWVIDHPKGVVVFDTGNNVAVTQDCKAYWQPGLCDFPELPEGFDLEARGEDFYRHYIGLALERSGGVQTKAAELLGMSFRSFRYYAKKFNLR